MILRTPDRTQLEQWFSQKLPEVEQLEIIEMKRSFPGMSRETWFLLLQWQQGGRSEQRRYVLRTQLPGGVSLAPMPLAYEARVFEILSQTNVPISKLLWVENDPRWLIDGERPFFVREMTPGCLEPANIRDPDPAHNAARIETVQELLRKLALIHRLDWRALGFGDFMVVPPNTAECARFELDSHFAYMRAHRLQPFPAATEAVLALRDTPPPQPACIVLRKENNGLGEEIWANDRIEIVAMSDWETASLGDPALDLAVALRTTGWAWNLDDMLAYYESCSGIHIERASVEFYTTVWNLKMVIHLHAGLELFTSGRDRRLQLATLGLYTHIAEAGLIRAAQF